MRLRRFLMIAGLVVLGSGIVAWGGVSVTGTEMTFKVTAYDRDPADLTGSELKGAGAVTVSSSTLGAASGKLSFQQTVEILHSPETSDMDITVISGKETVTEDGKLRVLTLNGFVTRSSFRDCSEYNGEGPRRVTITLAPTSDPYLYSYATIAVDGCPSLETSWTAAELSRDEAVKIVLSGDTRCLQALPGCPVAAATSPATTAASTVTTATTTTPATPTEFTLKVDGTTVTDTLATGKYTDSGGTVVNGSYSVPTAQTVGATLTATASANAPLPAGWSITIFTGAGTICKTTTTSCGPAQATFPTGANADLGITAQLNTTTGYYSATVSAWAVLPTTS